MLKSFNLRAHPSLCISYGINSHANCFGASKSLHRHANKQVVIINKQITHDTMHWSIPPWPIGSPRGSTSLRHRKPYLCLLFGSKVIRNTESRSDLLRTLALNHTGDLGATKKWEIPTPVYVKSRSDGIIRKLAATIKSISSSVGILTKLASHSETTSRMLLLFRGLSISARGLSAW